jgi:hypothetical protein
MHLINFSKVKQTCPFTGWVVKEIPMLNGPDPQMQAHVNYRFYECWTINSNG